MKFTATIQLETPRELFDHLHAQGVLCLNAGLTITRYKSGGAPEQTRGHLPFWKPVVGQVLRSIATRNDGHVVFLTLGQFAQKLLVSERVKADATAAGTWGARAIDLAMPHPVSALNLAYEQAANHPARERNKITAKVEGGLPLQRDDYERWMLIAAYAHAPSLAVDS